MSLENLHLYHTFMEIFKILKFSTPRSIENLFKFCPRNNNFRLIVPLQRLAVSQQNFVFTSTNIWNDHITHVLEKPEADENGLIIPGSNPNSDLTASIMVGKDHLKSYLPSRQKLGDPTYW